MCGELCVEKKGYCNDDDGGVRGGKRGGDGGGVLANELILDRLDRKAVTTSVRYTFWVNVRLMRAMLIPQWTNLTISSRVL